MQVSIHAVNNKKSMWSGILQCKQDETIRMMKFKNCVRYFQGYTCNAMSLVFQCKPDETIQMMKFKIVWGISRDIHVCPWYFKWFPNGEKTSTSPYEICFIPVNFSKKKNDEVSINIFFLLYTDMSRGDQNSSTVPFYLRQNRWRGFILIHQSC